MQILKEEALCGHSFCVEAHSNPCQAVLQMFPFGSITNGYRIERRDGMSTMIITSYNLNSAITTPENVKKARSLLQAHSAEIKGGEIYRTI